MVERIGKDILRILINTYFHPREAFSCLRVNKLFHRLVDRETVIRKYLIWKEYEDNKEYIKLIEDTHCKICNEIVSKNNMKKHLQKHQNNKKKIYVKKDLRYKPCKHCNLPYLGSKEHQNNCRMRKVACSADNYIWLCYQKSKDFISLCNKNEGYLNEMKAHECNCRSLRLFNVF